MNGNVATLIVVIGWLLMAIVSFRMSRRALQTGEAPWQAVLRMMGRPLITRERNRFAYWYMTAPTIGLFIWTAAGSIVLVLALLGVFGPLGDR